MKTPPIPSSLLLRRSVLAAALLAFSVSATRADIQWIPELSDYNETAFVAHGGGVGATQGSATAYGAGQNSGGTFTFGFSNFPGAPSAIAQTELAATDLPAGTVLTLRFAKGAADRINFIAIVGDPGGVVRYRSISATEFELRAQVVDTAVSASGTTGASFGLVVDYQSLPSMDFKASVFVTDMHYFDVAPPRTTPTGLAGINGTGVNGQAAIFRAFLPTTFLQSIGLTDPSQCKGYIDGIETPPGDLVNEGLDENALGFQFADGGDDRVLRVELTIDTWSGHDVQFGLRASAPALPRLTLSRPRVFPATAVGKHTKPQTIRVTNIGSTAASGITARLSGKAARDFRLTRPADTLAPGAATSFRATFRPRAKGARKATVTVRAGNAAATSVPLKGRGR